MPFLFYLLPPDHSLPSHQWGCQWFILWFWNSAWRIQNRWVLSLGQWSVQKEVWIGWCLCLNISVLAYSAILFPLEEKLSCPVSLNMLAFLTNSCSATTLGIQGTFLLLYRHHLRSIPLLYTRSFVPCHVSQMCASSKLSCHRGGALPVPGTEQVQRTENDFKQPWMIFLFIIVSFLVSVYF